MNSMEYESYMYFSGNFHNSIPDNLLSTNLIIHSNAQLSTHISNVVLVL